MGQQLSTAPVIKPEEIQGINRSNNIQIKLIAIKELSQQTSINPNQKQYTDINSIPNARAGQSNPYPQQNPNYNQHSQMNQNLQIQKPNVPRRNYKGSKNNFKA